MSAQPAVLVDPEDVDSIRNGIERVLEDEELRAKIGAAGRERARSFTWEKTARETLKFLEAHHQSRRTVS